MLSRRHLRIKVMQALYSFFQDGAQDAAKSEKALFASLEKMYDTYLYLLILFVELAECAVNNASDEQQKYFPSQAHVLSSNRIAQLKTIQFLRENQTISEHVKKRKISWSNDHDLVLKIYNEIKKSKEYGLFVAKENTSNIEENDFLIQVFKKFVAESYTVQHLLSEKNIHWIDDSDLVNSMVIRTIKSVSEENKENFFLAPLFKDIDDDIKFTRDLFLKTILQDSEFEAVISEKTVNWDVERIAVLDIIMMKMALSEILNMPSIPVKVSINEYLEISKEYSSPKSKVFINGIVDKIVLELKAADKIMKTGRGLME
jgi:N utilization substance protein B